MKSKIRVVSFMLLITVIVSACSNASSSNNVATPGANTNGNVNSVGQSSTVTTNSPWVGSKNTTRINSSDPIQTAAIVSQTLWMATSDMNRPGGIVLTNAENWQTVLVSADLIHFPNNGPILFVNNDGIPEATLNEINRLKPTGVDMNKGVQVILVGNISQNIEDQLNGLGFETDKITGQNPADIARAIDAYYTKVSGENPPSVVVGSMDSQEYTLPAINWISHMPEPLLYVNKDAVPNETIEALQTRNGNANIYLLGPESVVSSNVEKQLGKYGKVIRISGEDPYENAIAFAKYKDLETGFGWGITTPGHNFSFVNKDNPELAIAAAPFSHLGKHAPLLWTDKDKMPEKVMKYLMSVQPKYKESPTEGPYNHSWLTGGEDSLSKTAQGEIDALLEITSESGEGHGGHTMKPETPSQPDEAESNMTNMPGMEH